MSLKLNSQFQTGNSCTSSGNGGFGSHSWDSIHNLVATEVAWTKENSPKKLWVISRPPNSYCLSHHLLTSFLLWLSCPLQRRFVAQARQCLVSSVSVSGCLQRAVLMRSAAGTAGRQTPWLQCQKVRPWSINTAPESLILPRELCKTRIRHWGPLAVD